MSSLPTAVSLPDAAQPAGAFALLHPALQRAVAQAGYTQPTPIQEALLPPLLDGRDAIGIAQTGTGKTAAFVLPLLQRLAASEARPRPGRPRAIVLAPTRELAQQIGESVRTYGRFLPLTHALAYGGVPTYPQAKALRRGVDLLIATPGRLLDLRRRGHADWSAVELFVLDEVDRMLDMGFIDDIRAVVDELPAQRQTAFLSATMPPRIRTLSATLVQDPVQVTIAPKPLDLARIEQSVLFVGHRDKTALLLDRLTGEGPRPAKVIVFTARKHMADEVARALHEAGIRSKALHGDKSQAVRSSILEAFRRDRFRVLVATDVAARGLDVDDITHVVNYDLPTDAETYQHRIGRTGRAGASGVALSFCASGEQGILGAVQRHQGRALPVDADHPWHCERAERSARPAARPPRAASGGPRGRKRSTPPWAGKGRRTERARSWDGKRR